jgi:hypothetical protein
MIAPVCRFTLWTVQVYRELISRFPSASRWTALMWNQSHSVSAEPGSGLWLSRWGTWSVLSHWNSTLPARMSISCTMPSMTAWSAGPPMEVRFAVAVLKATISAVFQA